MDIHTVLAHTAVHTPHSVSKEKKMFHFRCMNFEFHHFKQSIPVVVDGMVDVADSLLGSWDVAVLDAVESFLKYETRLIFSL